MGGHPSMGSKMAGMMGTRMAKGASVMRSSVMFQNSSLGDQSIDLEQILDDEAK